MLEEVRELQKMFSERGWTLSLAESCTGGGLSHILTSVPGASSFFLGSVVSYSEAVKARILGVPETLFKEYTAVSLPVASTMARGVRAQLQSDWSLSITGLAGPDGGSEEIPVGTVCFAVVGPSFEWCGEERFEGGREEVIHSAIKFALGKLLELPAETFKKKEEAIRPQEIV